MRPRAAARTRRAPATVTSTVPPSGITVRVHSSTPRYGHAHAGQRLRCRGRCPDASSPQRSGRSSSSATPPPSRASARATISDGGGRGLRARGTAAARRRACRPIATMPAPSAYSARFGRRRVEQHHPVQRAEGGQREEREPAGGRHRQRRVARRASARPRRRRAAALIPPPPPSRRRRRLRVVRKPWQPATSNTARRFGSAPGITRMQPPGVRPSPRGGRSIGRAATSTTRPRRFCAATSDGPIDSSSSASRTCAAGHASRSFSITCARRSPGSSSEQPLRRAKCTVSEAAARTALSSASCDAGARGSSTTSGRESASEISLRSISPWPRATAGQWMREAGEPGRCSRRPSSSVSAAAISAARACAGVASPPPAVARTGQHARQHEHLVAVSSPVTTRWASPNGSRSTSAGGASRRRPRRPNVTSTRTRAVRLPARKRTGSGSSGSSIQPGGSGSRPAVARMRTSSGCSSSTLRAPSSRLHLRAPRAGADPAGGAERRAAPAPSR